ncbi:MAG: FAD-linked oxidase C-terminal domain-containing protein [Candidatus Latescibacterota bacterium]|nr:FAD-linked oxidase C-terminal domain-containing protein [Candidatus Latescibacterota bacterium]
MLYRTDASIYEIEPLGAAFPRDAAQVESLTKIAAKHGFALLPRGGGTSLAGQSVGACLHVDYSVHMNRVLEVNREERWACVQPGVVLDELNARLKPDGLQFGPDVSTSSRANLGGMIGNNSCGARSLVYGKTIDHVLELDVVFADGVRTRLGPVDEAERRSRGESAGIEGAIYRKIGQIAERYRDEIDSRFPKLMRRVSGYNLDEFVGGDRPFDLTKVVVGSEGTLCSVVEAKLNLVEVPDQKVIIACQFADIVQAMEANLLILETEPASIELVDKLLLDQTRGQLEHESRRWFLQDDPEAILFVEYAGSDLDHLIQRGRELEQQLRRQQMGYAFVHAETAAAQQDMWELRKAGLGLLMRMKGDAKPQPGIEDTSVPVEALPQYIREVRDLMAEMNVTADYYGHASVGVIHIRPVIDLKVPEGIQRLRMLEERMADLVAAHGGAISAEHGDGLARSEWIERMFGQQLVQAFAEVKATFDPQGIMNPGKIVAPPRMDENLRYGDGYAQSAPINSYFRYEEAGGFQAAVELCSGVGHCRKKLVGTMCPSYMVTLDEQHSTRGRANALRAALAGRMPEPGLASEELHEVMDLCLECKACKAECPSSVDMAKLKSEFLAHYHAKHGFPQRSHLFARIDRINRLLAPFAAMVNPILQSAPNRWLMERLFGIDRRRRMPALARQRFSRWLGVRDVQAGGQTVVLFNDTFTEFNHPEVGQAATALLERAGFTVKLPRTSICCGRPLISKGFLDKARRQVNANIDSLMPYAEADSSVVVLEPSCLSAFQDDYLDLASNAEAARKVAGTMVPLETFLAEHIRAHGVDMRFSSRSVQILYHGHCHQKAFTGTAHALEMLNLPPKYEATEVASGCCGMAGSFGYEVEHYDISQQVGQERLFDVISATDPAAEIAISGNSCRHQIADATGRRVRHWAEVVAEAL